MPDSLPDTSFSAAFAATIAARMQDSAASLAGRWLDRLLSLIPVAPNEVFPTNSILDHVPVLIEQIARYVGASDDDIVANTFVVAKARELGELRYAQDASVHQLLREYEVLRGILETFVVEQIAASHPPPDALAALTSVRRINQAVGALTQTTVDTFINRYVSTIAAQQQRLTSFNRMVSHELRQPLAALQAAAGVLRLGGSSAVEAKHDKAVAAIERNIQRLVELTRTIGRVSGMTSSGDESQPSMQTVSLATIAGEAARQLRQAADSRGVTVSVDATLPDVLADVGQLELLLVNLLSNGIKYSDPAKSGRYVTVEGLSSDDDQCVFCVRDNGIGMTDQQLASVFTPFFRGHVDRDRELGVEGLGLGLSIVRDCSNALNATVNVDSVDGDGTTFTIAVPLKGRSAQ
jgi:signal transduction histidine kinase